MSGAESDPLEHRSYESHCCVNDRVNVLANHLSGSVGHGLGHSDVQGVAHGLGHSDVQGVAHGVGHSIVQGAGHRVVQGVGGHSIGEQSGLGRPGATRRLVPSVVPSVVRGLVVMCWIPAVLYADRSATGSQQVLLGLATWTLLAVLLRRERRLVQLQTAVVIVFATIVEYTFSAGLHVYVYRLDHVPAYVPPGHGLVYLGALSLGRLVDTSRRSGRYVAATAVAGAAYAAWGLFLSSRPDALGAIWYLCLLGFLVFGRSRHLYVGAFVVVTYLELIGTRWGVWSWRLHDPTGLVSIGNPPSGAAGGYGWFDLVAVLAAARLATKWDAAMSRVRRRLVAERVSLDPRSAESLTQPREAKTAVTQGLVAQGLVAKGLVAKESVTEI